MTTPNGNPFPEYSKLADAMADQWEKGMSAWWDQVLDSPAFVESMGKNLSAQVKARKQAEGVGEAWLHQMNLPSRADIARLGRISTLLEQKLLQMEDVLLELRDQLSAQQGRLELIEREALQARVEAAEARLELRERLAALQQKIEAMDQGAARKPRGSADAR
jgi:hypothetical protein